MMSFSRKKKRLLDREVLNEERLTKAFLTLKLPEIRPLWLMMALFFLKDPFFQTLQDFSLVFAWFQPINFITAILFLKPTNITYTTFLFFNW